MPILKAQKGEKLKKLWEDTKADFHKQYVPEGMSKKDYDTMAGTVYNVGGLSKIGAAPDAMGKAMKYLAVKASPVTTPIMNKVNPIIDKAKGLLPSRFKSEINWAKWNKEIPSNKALMDEYNTIEKTSKAKGTWMKNPDGSRFVGTPEQFVQQNSKNFNKAFPGGHNKVHRGIMDGTGEIADNKAMFVGDEDLALLYSGTDKTKIGPHDINKKSGMYELAHRKSPNSFEFDAGNDYFSNISMTPKTGATKEIIQSELDHITKARALHADRLSKATRTKDGKWKLPDSEFEYNDAMYNDGTSGFDRDIRRHERRLADLETSTRNPELLEKYRKDLGDFSTTDDIAKHVEKTGTDYVKLKNVSDFGLGDVSIVNHKKGNYLKSLYGNNGMFDMTNPNIFKSVAPLAVVGTGAGLLKRK